MENGNSTRTTLIILGGGLLIGLLMGAFVFIGMPKATAATEPLTTSSTPAPMTGAPAPEFTLANISGAQVSLKDLKGQPVLINYWATWCVPCKDEMPAIEAAYQEHKDKGFTVLAVDADEGLNEVTSFVSTLGVNFEILMDPGSSVNELYRVRAYPTSFFVGRDGTIQAMQIGVMSEAQLVEHLAKILE
jgi:cytochrome c biogenesis protein CcmG, thiol:disulfide interchange protein DsbE